MFFIGLSTRGKPISEELFYQYQEAGIEAVEIASSMEVWKELNLQEIKRWADRYGIRLWSGHLPYYSAQEEIDLSSPDSHYRKRLLQCFSDLLGRGVEAGIDKFVVHPSSEPIAEQERTERIKCAQDSLFLLTEKAAEYGAAIAMENLPRSCLGRNSMEVAHLLETHPKLRMCCDVNHQQQEPIDEFIRQFADRIITVHISDHDFIDERHWLPGEGDADWNKIFRSLKDIGYQGAWMYEVSFTCPDTILRDRDLTCQDIARNAREIFSGQKPTVIALGRKATAPANIP